MTPFVVNFLNLVTNWSSDTWLPCFTSLKTIHFYGTFSFISKCLCNLANASSYLFPVSLESPSQVTGKEFTFFCISSFINDARIKYVNDSFQLFYPCEIFTESLLAQNHGWLYLNSNLNLNLNFFADDFLSLFFSNV